jgi:hypothetical protein
MSVGTGVNHLYRALKGLYSRPYRNTVWPVEPTQTFVDSCSSYPLRSNRGMPPRSIRRLDPNVYRYIPSALRIHIFEMGI